MIDGDCDGASILAASASILSRALSHLRPPSLEAVPDDGAMSSSPDPLLWASSTRVRKASKLVCTAERLRILEDLACPLRVMAPGESASPDVDAGRQRAEVEVSRLDRPPLEAVSPHRPTAPRRGTVWMRRPACHHHRPPGLLPVPAVIGMRRRSVLPLPIASRSTRPAVQARPSSRRGRPP